jgi:oligoribonuclease NrnB/cAMP/cGMP phosphodiesterase (DHH superfamily)
MVQAVLYTARMVSLPKPDIIITHESDLDGLVSGILLQRLAQKLFNQRVTLEAHHYHTWRQREIREPAGWVCDLAFDSRLDKTNWVIVDHHATDCVPARAVLVHDLKKSAGLLCYELCQEHGLGSPALDRLIHLNNVSDLFLESDPDFELANDYANLVKVYGFWNLLALIGGHIEKLLEHPLLEVMAAKRRIEDPLGFEWSQRNVQELSPTVGFVDTVIGNNNLIVHQLLESKATPYPVLLTLFRRANGAIIASLRSRNGDALKVAERLQGGGHANAAGATLPKSVRSMDDALIYLRQTLNPNLAQKDPGLNNLDALFASLEEKPR